MTTTVTLDEKAARALETLRRQATARGIPLERYLEALADDGGQAVAARTPPGRVRRTEGVAGGDACVGDSRIPVWTLVQLQRLGRSEEQLLADFPGMTQADLDAVWAYYREHAGEIEGAILAEARED